jgi:hypothetical protein
MRPNGMASLFCLFHELYAVSRIIFDAIPSHQLETAEEMDPAIG